jgi:hypothetical protein
LRLPSFFERRPRSAEEQQLANYPPRIRRFFGWIDALTDWQRIQYACVAILFLLACGGYLLGLGSTILLQRAEAAQEAALAAAPLPTLEPTPTETAEPLTPTPAPTRTALPTETAVPPTKAPTSTPINVPMIAEPAPVLRQVPAAPAPAAPVAPVAPKPTSTLEKPTATSVPTAAPVRTVRATATTAVRQVTPAATSRATVAATQPPSPASPVTAVATGGPTRPPAASTPAGTPIKTPGVR